MKYACVLLSLGAVSCIEPLVKTKNGFVHGVIEGNIVSFLGIPYAEVDRNNPFGDALDASRFEGIYMATNDGAICPQQEDIYFTIVGSLDCLRVNVYVPDYASHEHLLPVMVFIHGGHFSRWNPNRDSYGPDFLVNKGVILVTFNYRLGPYGFMSLNRSDIPGNAGLRDQLKALEWVKRFIAAFGGDEDNITLFGEGAGAASVEFHILSEYSKNLFQKAILQSGTVLCDWVMTEPDVQAPIKLARYLGFTTDDVDDALQYLYTFDPKEVISATLRIGYIESFKPVVEHGFVNVKTMIRDKPSSLLREAFLSIPIIIGFNSREERRNIRHYLKSKYNYFVKANATFKAKIDNYFKLDKEDLEEAEKVARYFYIGDEKIGPNTVDAMFEFNSDFTFIYPSLRNSRYYLEAGLPVYLYVFNYAGKRNYMKNRFMLDWETEAINGDEIGYLFQQSYYDLQDSDEDKLTIEWMTTMWTDFAKTSNPTPARNPFILTWKPATTKFPLYALLSDTLQMIQHPYQHRMVFWDRFFEIYGERTRW